MTEDSRTQPRRAPIATPRAGPSRSRADDARAPLAPIVLSLGLLCALFGLLVSTRLLVIGAAIIVATSALWLVQNALGRRRKAGGWTTPLALLGGLLVGGVVGAGLMAASFEPGAGDLYDFGPGFYAVIGAVLGAIVGGVVGVATALTIGIRHTRRSRRAG